MNSHLLLILTLTIIFLKSTHERKPNIAQLILVNTILFENETRQLL